MITFLIGGLGAGKTELAINLAIWKARSTGPGRTFLLDLDIVNPFFRVRKVRADLEKAGVVLVAPDPRAENGDLPALPAAIWAAFERPDGPIVCDVGGGELGLRPLARLTDLASQREVETYCVLNPFRPWSSSVDLMIAALKRFSDLSALTITHIVPNPHLSDETTIENFTSGYEKVREVAGKVGLPIPFAVMGSNLAGTLGAAISPHLSAAGTACGQFKFGEIPLFVIRRFWEKPWQLGFASGEAAHSQKSLENASQADSRHFC